jgi:hypothetical protein
MPAGGCSRQVRVAAGQRGEPRECHDEQHRATAKPLQPPRSTHRPTPRRQGEERAETKAERMRGDVRVLIASAEQRQQHECGDQACARPREPGPTCRGRPTIRAERAERGEHRGGGADARPGAINRPFARFASAAATRISNQPQPAP